MRYASVALIDARGRILFQERDEHPAVDPERWGFPGGGIEPGETALQAAHRELEEETGVRLDDDPELYGDFEVHCTVHGSDRCALFATRADLTDGDVECHEGRQMVFVDPEVALGLDLTQSAAQLLPRFLASDLYARLRR